MDDKEGGTSSDWSELTQECLFNILNRLTLEQRWQGPLFVCKSWHQSCQDPYLNLVINLESKFNSVRELAWFWTPQFETKIDGMVRSVVVWSDGLVREIKVRHCSDHGLALVAQRCPNLEVLSVKSCPRVTDETIAAIALNCPKLRELDVSYCYEISHRSLALIGQHCPNLRILRRNFMNWMDPSQHVGIVPGDYLNAIPQDGDDEAAAIAKCMKNLRRLELRFSKITAKGLAMICEGCQDLEYLDISGWAHVTSRDIMNATSTLKNLEDIKKPNFYIPRSVFHTERYGHWQLYDERFQTDAFRI
ncbi:ubiquitin-protein ligase [Lithospermum erythrorhizon]|uniref:Ubiquitin-protein ligase n=1 Tax=Lithospermum erythrorhizon TaxID=34254 RepID=A0AAV3QZE3_LITER